jgi:hypothetical protein
MYVSVSSVFASFYDFRLDFETVLTEWHFFPHIINFFVCEAFPIMRSGNNILLYIIGFV